MAIDTSPQADAAPRTRRALLAGALGGLAATAAAALGRPQETRAAAGSPLIIGSQANSAGTADTQLIANSSVISFKLLQTGQGTALMGHATSGFGGTRGVYGRTDSPNGDGVQARNAGGAGTGAAMRAFGVNNTGLEASTDNAARVAIHATNSVVDGTVALFENTGEGTGTQAGPAIRAYTGGGSNADVHPAGTYSDAAGEFAGPVGVIGASIAGGGLGVVGLSPSYIGVRGESPVYIGVSGVSNSGYGVHGQSDSSRSSVRSPRRSSSARSPATASRSPRANRARKSAGR